MSISKAVFEKMKLAGDYVKAKEDFLEMVNNILELTGTPYKIDGDFIGEVCVAGFNYKDGDYLAIDCGIINKYTDESHGDTLFIPLNYLGMTKEKLSEIEKSEVMLLSLESEKLKSEDVSLVKRNRLLN